MKKNLQLADLCDLIVDCKNRTPPAVREGETPVGHAIGTPHIGNGKIRLSSANLVSQETFDTWTARAVPQADDVVLSREAPVGRVGRVEPGMSICLGQRTMLMRPNPEVVDPRYLSYLLLGPQVQNELHSRASGSTVPHLRVDQVRHLAVPEIPEISVQRSVAAVLGALDDKIAVNEQISQTSRELGLYMYRAHLNRYDHRQPKLADVTSTIIRGGTPRYTDPENGMVVVNQKCVRSGRVSLAKARHTVAAKVREDRLLRPGDVLVNSTGVGTLGRVGLWNHDIEATVDSHVTIVRFDPATVNPILGAYALFLIQPRIEALGEGTTGQTELSRTKLGNLLIPLPNSDSSSELATSFTSLEQSARARLTENHILEELRDTLLPQLLTGKLRIKDAERAVEDAV